MYGTYFYAYSTNEYAIYECWIRHSNSIFNVHLFPFPSQLNIGWWHLFIAFLIVFKCNSIFFLSTTLQPFVWYSNLLKGWSHLEKEYYILVQVFLSHYMTTCALICRSSKSNRISMQCLRLCKNRDNMKLFWSMCKIGLKLITAWNSSQINQ